MEQGMHFCGYAAYGMLSCFNLMATFLLLWHNCPKTCRCCSQVTTTICNLILGKVYLDHHGTMHIRGNRQYSCKLKFKEQSFLDRNPHQVNDNLLLSFY